MRCGERQDRWYICENHAEWRMCLVLVWRLSRSVALTSACCLPSLFLDTLWCHVLCVCSQRCRFMCDGLHNILYIGSSEKRHPHCFARIRHTFPKLGQNADTVTHVAQNFFTRVHVPTPDNFFYHTHKRDTHDSNTHAYADSRVWRTTN